MQIAVVGGANVDLMAKCSQGFKLHDSNIATIKTSHGGVGRNIVHNCALLGLECSFYSAVGNDDYANALIEKLNSLGVNTEGVFINEGYSTGMYISFMDEEGDMLCAVNDMQVIDTITPEILRKYDFSDMLIAFDANLKSESIEYLLDLDSKVFAEPVSVAKGVKLKPFLNKIDIIKPNIYEASMLSDMQIFDESDIIRAGKKLVSAGVKKVFITAGDEGVYAFSGDEYVHIAPSFVNAVNATGAGDAFSAGILYAEVNGYDLEQTCRFATECAVNAILCIDTVNEKLNADYINSKIKE